MLNIAAGIGLLRLRGWARPVALALSSFVLLFMYAPGVDGGGGERCLARLHWPGVVGYLVVLFAVLRAGRRSW